MHARETAGQFAGQAADTLEQCMERHTQRMTPAHGWAGIAASRDGGAPSASDARLSARAQER